MSDIIEPIALDSTLQRVASALETMNQNNGDTKADKVASAVAGNFAGLDANGNLTDSGHKPSDYLTPNDISGKLDSPETAGTVGQHLRVATGGGVEWASVGEPSDLQVETAVEAWLDDHPEATTTVEDGSITREKLDSTVGAAVDDVSDLKSALDGNILADRVKIIRQWMYGSVNNTTGEVSYTNNTRAHATYVKLIKGAVYTIKNGYEFCAYAYDLTGSVASFVEIKIDHYVTDYIATDTATVAFVVRSKSAPNVKIDDLTDIEMYVSYSPYTEIQNEVENGIAEDITGIPISGLVLVGSTGTESSNANYSTTRYIPVNEGDVLLITACCAGNLYNNTYTGLYGYDDKSVFVSVLVNQYIAYGWYSSFSGYPNSTIIYQNYKLTVPSGVSYVRLSSRTSGGDSMPPKVYRLSNVDLDSIIGTMPVQEIPLKFTSGGVNNDTGEDTTNNARCRSERVVLESGYIFTCTDGYGFVFYEYNRNTGAYIAPMHTAYVKTYRLSSATFVRIVAKKDDGTTISDPTAFHFYATKIDTETIEEKIGDVQDTAGTSTVPVWSVGSLNASGGEVRNTYGDRLRTNYMKIGNDTINVKTNGQKIAVCLYDSSFGFLLNTGWKYGDFDIFKINTAEYVRFVVGELDDSDITPADVDAIITFKNGTLNTADTAQKLADGFITTPYAGNVEVIMHRGYNSIAPENTIPAFQLARKMGFSTIETDIQLSSDNVPVILHDSSINRTSNSTGYVYNKTLAELKTLDFGSWKSTMWAGTPIPTFEEMIACCKKIGLNVYIEIKEQSPWTQELISACVEIVRKYGMKKHVTWITFSSTILGYVINADETARIGFLMNEYTTGAVDTCVSLRTGKNEVIAVTRWDLLSSSVLAYMIEKDVPLAAYMYDKTLDVDTMEPYVSAALTNEFNVMEYVYGKNIGF